MSKKRPSINDVVGPKRGKLVRAKERRLMKRYEERSYAPLKKKKRKPGSGGGRSGAGRPHVTQEARERRKVALQAATRSLEPLDYMLSVMRDLSAKTNRRDSMAISAAPYRHHKLHATKITGGNDQEEALKMHHEVVIRHVKATRQEDEG